jgi:phage terminase large subunit-like protein
MSYTLTKTELYLMCSRLAMGNRGKLAQLIAITTAGQKTDMTGQDSIAYNQYQYGKRVASGEQVDPTFFMAWWAASRGS